jgi:glycyl-tRNA synthetase beta chain
LDGKERVGGVSDFLLELLSEEIPARMQARAREDLARLFEAEIAKAGLKAEAIETFSTPRRLALIARNLPEQTEAVRDELKGPRTSAPPKALEGFLRKTGLTQDQLTERDGVYYAVIDKPGRATASVLAEAIPAIIRGFPWPKSMRWGAPSISTESLRWVRPLHGIVALLGGEIAPCEIDGIASGAETVGHRFHHPGRITIGSADDYAAKLRACHVIVDHQERESIIAEAATRMAAEAGLRLVRDEALLRENAGLTEWPVPLLGSFDASFLEVPPEVIQLTMAANQKYFACMDGQGTLAPVFICTANVEPRDGGATIVAGNQKVLAARLSDATFFWEHDLKVPLEDQAKKLGQIVFHEKLGTVADKVDRVAKLARWLVEEGIVGAQESARPEPSRGALVQGSEPRPAISLGTSEDLAGMAEQAARLCKADLVTGMVGEFPELQGVMGGYYARAQGYPDAVADAIRDHYKPVGQGDEVPTAPVTVAVSLADKLDTVVGFFAIDQRPTGSKDPFALRRAMLGVVAIIRANALRRPLHAIIRGATDIYLDRYGAQHPITQSSFGQSQVTADVFATGLIRFAVERLIVQMREENVRHDFISAAFEQGLDSDLVRLLARVRALQSFVETPEGADLLAGYKRAANILKKEGWNGEPIIMADDQGIPQTGEEDPLVLADDPLLGDAIAAFNRPNENSLSYTPAPEESALIAALDSAEPRARAAVEAEDFEGAMAALATLRAPVDAFFDKVTVNDPDPAKRAARLNLLARMRDAVHQVADFSRIEG